MLKIAQHFFNSLTRVHNNRLVRMFGISLGNEITGCQFFYPDTCPIVDSNLWYSKNLLGLIPKAQLVLMRNNLILLFVSFLTFLSETYGQEKYTKSQIAQLIKQGKYADVYSSVELGYRTFNRDPDYIFWLGLCKVELNYDIPQAINLLNEATQQDTHKESWFYLGRANMLNYEFTRATELFKIFEEKASRNEMERTGLSQYQAMCRNAADLCSRSRKLTVTRVDTIAEKDLLAYLNKQQTGGTFEFSNEGGGSGEIGKGIFFRENNRVFFTKYSFGKKNKDIFISGNDEIEVNKAKNIGKTLNTASEEEFVYYDATVPAIYFSSQGHNSGGGYDIFRSCFDKITQKWSKPENLGFPVNTPGDEIAWVNIPGTKRSILAARRNSAPGKAVLYTIENAESASVEQIAPAQAFELFRLKPGNQTAFPTPQSKSAIKKPVLYKKHEVPVEIRDDKSYGKLIHEALCLQISSDSVSRISDQKKELLISAKTENEKKRLWQEIRLLDSKADEIRQKADLLYKKARQIEVEKQAITVKNSQELAQKAFQEKNNHLGSSGGVRLPGEVPNRDMPLYNGDIQYRIQVGVFSKSQPEVLFKGFSNLYKESVKDGTAFKYYVGLYNKVGEAEKELVKVKDAGFKDAYIIGFYKGKIVPLSRARELEKLGNYH